MDGKVSNFIQLASVRRYTMTGGSMQGLRVIDCDNGKLRFLLNETKALDVMQLFHEGQNVSFVSKNGFTASSGAFAGRFEGGMVYTCGLEGIGAREGCDLHGSFHNHAAEVIRTECDEKGIMIEAEIRNSELFGRNLKMKRKIFSAIGSETVTIEDTLVNEGYRDEQYCLLYHVNVGYPLLDENAKVVGEIEKCVSRTQWAEDRANLREVITAPVPQEEETCYFLTLKKPEISLINAELGKTFTLSYSKDTLPCFVQWKSMASGDYALGLEPCTGELDENFRYAHIAPGKSVLFSLNLSIHK